MFLSSVTFLLFLVFAIWITWGGFLMMMPLKRNLEAGRLNTWNKIFGYPWAALFIILDFSFNMIFGTIIFFDIPRTFLFTGRLDYFLSRENRSDVTNFWQKLTYWNNWRFRISYYFCTRFLDPFDPDGYHCKKRK